MIRTFQFAVVLVLGVSTAVAQNSRTLEVEIRIDCTKTKRTLKTNPTGFCMSFLTDADNAQRKQPLADVVKSMRMGSLRYPMGTLAENYLFHDLRTGRPRKGMLRPRVITKKKAPGRWKWAVDSDGAFKSEILDFDEFVEMCRKSNTEPVVLVATHGHLFPGSEFKEEDILNNAAEWVRYANVTRKLGIKYWELGNEVDLKHPREVMSQDQYMKLYKKMASRMKAVDPGIRTGIGTCNGGKYISDGLKLFPNLVDFVVVHHYMGWLKTHDQYVRYDKSLLGKSARTLSIIDKTAAASRRKDTEILITEFSSFCAGAKTVPEDRKKNSILNAMITFEMLAEGIAMDDRIRFLHFWVTHSPWGGRTGVDYANAFAPDNAVLPQGRAMEIMGRFIQSRMLHVQCPKGPVRCWASGSKSSHKLAVWLVNRTEKPQKTSLDLVGFTAAKRLATWSLVGRSPHDTAPGWGAGKNVVIRKGAVNVILPPLSITVLHNIK
jgi:alpha-L-arabinofuranosidase